MCSKCHRRAYCSVTCQRMDWKDGGHKRTCRPPKDFHKDDVVIVVADRIRTELNGQLMVVEGPDQGAESRWMVARSIGDSISLHADEMQLVVPAEEREDVGPSLEE